MANLFPLLDHLWPDISLAVLNSGHPSALTAWFWLFLIGLFVFALALTLIFSLRAYLNIRKLHTCVHGIPPALSATEKLVLLQEQGSFLPARLQALWQDYCNGFVCVPTQANTQELKHPISAHEYFNADTLAASISNNRLLAATPSFLVALGVLGTFVGLTLGLSELQLNEEAGVAQLRSGINAMIAGAAVAFATSVWGVLLSLLLNIAEKLCERQLKSSISHLQYAADQIAPRLLMEHPLVQSQQALADLPQALGTHLQHALSGVSTEMEKSITQALTQVMQPALQNLVQQAQEQSTQALDTLVQRFMESLSGAGDNQRQMLEQASQNMNQALIGMSNQLAQTFQTLSQHQDTQLELNREQAHQMQQQYQSLQEASSQHLRQLETSFVHLSRGVGQQIETQLAAVEIREQERQAHFNEQLHALQAQQRHLLDAFAHTLDTQQAHGEVMAQQHHKVLQGLTQVSEAVSATGHHLDSSAHALSSLTQDLQRTSAALGQQLGAVAHQIEVAGTRHGELIDHLNTYANTLHQLQEHLLSSAQYFEQGAQQAQTSFSQLQTHQERFLHSLRQEVAQLGSHLADEVQGLEVQAQQWLQAYQKEVQTQVNERMQQWNQQTQGFASAMERSVRGMNALLDELEAQLHAKK
ncbi:hypothetical protein SAMN05421831_11243 [Allopseudospirillum japonicum]|uniref:Uncharacterized protein n=1 Tax=Allopseudospirillum japonicum TaxID=64971 RepID=A0A1H6TVC1_9GAMM|nr:anti-phage ZorAB system protein ZorA [Allopseudospirillum japonicum]SEI84008.1 hypothetical protein SAMN05421831_11243 [Allopseudospirillum japonicum]